MHDTAVVDRGSFLAGPAGARLRGEEQECERGRGEGNHVSKLLSERFEILDRAVHSAFAARFAECTRGPLFGGLCRRLLAKNTRRASTDPLRS